jgi:hypothetical protein
MKKNLFWLSPEEYILGPYQPEAKPEAEIHQTEPEFKPRVSWFPELLHAIPVGKFNLFQLVAGSENELRPNQKKLKEWICGQSQKHEPLKFPVFIEELFFDPEDQNAKEELAGKIIAHLKEGSMEMIFLPTLPVNPHLKQDHKKESSWLFKQHQVPIIFPTALA